MKQYQKAVSESSLRIRSEHDSFAADTSVLRTTGLETFEPSHSGLSLGRPGGGRFDPGHVGQGNTGQGNSGQDSSG